jgi:hypothetical protein
MSNQLDGMEYDIRVRGRLDEFWIDWVDNVTMTFQSEADALGVTVLRGVFDQAALRGVLSHLWDLNLTVLAVTPSIQEETVV